MATTTVLATLKELVNFGSSTVIFLAGVLGTLYFIYKTSTGGFGFMRAVNKVSKFVDRVDIIIDDFWPEILSGLEKKGFASDGATAKWTSAQARVLKSTSPIEITPIGQEIVNKIKFEEAYNTNKNKILNLVKDKLSGKTDIADLDIERASLKVGADLFDSNDPTISEAKKYLFQEPNTPVSELKVLLGIFIRDKIIKDQSVKDTFIKSLR